MTNPKCPKCSGMLRTEPVLAEYDYGESSYSDNIAQFGLEIVCICGFRAHLTGDHYRQYMKKKLVLASYKPDKEPKQHRKLPEKYLKRRVKPKC